MVPYTVKAGWPYSLPKLLQLSKEEVMSGAEGHGRQRETASPVLFCIRMIGPQHVHSPAMVRLITRCDKQKLLASWKKWSLVSISGVP